MRDGLELATSIKIVSVLTNEIDRQGKEFFAIMPHLIPSWRRRSETAAQRALKLSCSVLAAAVVILAIVFLSTADSFWVAGRRTSALASARKPGGALVICGGGPIPEEVRDRFLELAGGPQGRVLILPTISSMRLDPSGERVVGPWRNRGLESVRLLHAASRAEANDPAFASPLAEATGVWLGGGEQSWFDHTYVGTVVERELKALLERGGVIGGSSAGAAAMTQVMISRGRREAVEGRGFDLLPGAIVDQHFLKRNRMRRLRGMVAAHPDRVGLGIDEGTALLVELSGLRLRVLGESYVVAVTPSKSDHESRIEFLKRGDETDLASLQSALPMITPEAELESAVAAAESTH